MKIDFSLKSRMDNRLVITFGSSLSSSIWLICRALEKLHRDTIKWASRGYPPVDSGTTFTSPLVRKPT